MKAIVTLTLTANDLKTLNRQVEEIGLMFTGLKIDMVNIYGGKDAEHPSDASKVPDAPEPDLPSGSMRSPWNPGPGPAEIG